MARSKTVARTRSVTRAREDSPTGILGGSVLGTLGAATIGTQLVAAAAFGSFSLTMAFVGGFALVVGAMLALIPAHSPNVSNHIASPREWIEDFTPRQLARWLTTIALGGVGGMLAIMLTMRVVG